MSSDYLIETPCTGGTLLRVVFQFFDDRFHHSVGILTNGVFHTLLESLEGSANESWPSSPAFQEVSQQGTTALLVGMAGTSHFSASVEPRMDSIRFDLACRLKEPPTVLGSTYRLLQPAAPNSTSDNEDSSGQHSLNIPLQATHDSPSNSSHNVHIRPPHLSKELPQTARWSYEVRVKDASVILLAESAIFQQR